MFFRFINTSTTGIRQTLGKFSGLCTPGLNFYIPVLQKITIVSNRLVQNEFIFEAKTKDNVFTNLDISVQYRVKPDNSDKYYFSLDNPNDQIRSFVKNVIRACVPKMTIEEIFDKQDDIANRVLDGLHQKMESHGISFEDVLINDIIPDVNVKHSMNRIKAAEQLKVAAEHEAMANYITKVKDAEADRDRKILQGQGISGQRLAILKGYEDGLNNLSKQLGVNPTSIIDFVTKVQHLDTIETIGKSNNSKTIFIPHNMDKYSVNYMSAREGTSKE